MPSLLLPEPAVFEHWVLIGGGGGGVVEDGEAFESRSRSSRGTNFECSATCVW